MRFSDGVTGRSRSATGRTRWIFVIAFAVLLVVPATAFGARFGARLGNFDPDNGAPPQGCDPPPSDPCTRVAVAFDTGAIDGHIKAPITGTITTIRLRAAAAAPASFRLELARAKNITGSGGKAKLVRKGPVINYDGPDNTPDPPEVFHNIGLHVNQGDYLAIKSTRTSTLRCNSNGVRQLLFEPPLPLDGLFHNSSDKDGCTLMINATIKS
jgi:hypothetical protein